MVQATGYSPWRLARPVLVFGLIVALLTAVLTHVLVPASLARLRRAQAEIARERHRRGCCARARSCTRSDGVTFYIREITPEGELRDVFLSDGREPAARTTYTADRAYLRARRRRARNW